MRILVLLTDGFGSQGGIAKFNRDLLRALCAHPSVAEVVAIPRLLPDAPGQLPARLSYLTNGVGGKLKYLLAVAGAAIRHGPFDLLVCGHMNLLPAAAMVRWRIRGPLLLNVHGVDAWQAPSSRLSHHLAGRVDAVVAVAELTKHRFLSWSGVAAARCHVLPNSVDLSCYGPGPAPEELAHRYGLAGRTVIMTLARLSADERYKGVDEVLEAMPELAREIPNLSYLICGDGTDRARLEAKATQLGLRDRVVFTGRISEETKANHYRLAHAFVMPGWGEGFGIVYLEALACGIPVLASAVDGSREAVRNGELGVLVDPRVAGAVGDGIRQVLARSRGVVPPGLDYFSIANFTHRTHQLVDRLAPSGRGTAGR
jgi:phosphatidyl-myo-inositol dimannoside synthase